MALDPWMHFLNLDISVCSLLSICAENCEKDRKDVAVAWCFECYGFFCASDDDKIHAIGIFRHHQRDYDAQSFATYTAQKLAGLTIDEMLMAAGRLKSVRQVDNRVQVRKVGRRQRILNLNLIFYVCGKLFSAIFHHLWFYLPISCRALVSNLLLFNMHFLTHPACSSALSLAQSRFGNIGGKIPTLRSFAASASAGGSGVATPVSGKTAGLSLGSGTLRTLSDAARSWQQSLS